jgi:hypothetical protein
MGAKMSNDMSSREAFEGGKNEKVRKTFTVPAGHEAILDGDSRATGEVRPLPENFPQGSKDSNPKDAVGITKVPYSTISAPVLAELGLAMLEGSLKYGRHNYRFAGVRISVYYDACVARHMARFWEGEDIDPDTIVTDEDGKVIFEGISHVTKAIAGLVVIRDAMIQGKAIDDRPPASPPGWQDRINAGVTAFLKKYPNPVAPFLNGFKRGPGRIL